MALSCAVALLSLTPPPAAAVDQLLTGRKLLLKDTGRRNRLKLVAVDGALLVPQDRDAPTVAGAMLTIINPLTNEAQSVPLPAEDWRVNRSRTIYRYRNRDARFPNFVKSAVIRNRRMMKLVADSTGISLNESSQGALGFILTFGTVRYCLLFPPTSVARDEPCLFRAKRSVAPIACPGELAQ